MAAAVLLRVRDHGAYSNVLLPRATAELSASDQAFVYRLVTDALRNIRTIDAVIERTADRSLATLDPEVGVVLQVAVGELLMDRKDAVHATVNESVEACKQLGAGRAAGLVNGVLRTLTREGLPELPGDRARELSVPEWVLGKVTQDHGRGVAGELLRGLRKPPPGIGIRVRPGAAVPEGAEPVAGINGAYRVGHLGTAGTDVIVSDAASTAVAQAVAAGPAELILDMAAAPGGKTVGLWDHSSGKAQIVAMDAHQRRLRSARRRLAELGVEPHWVDGDAMQAPFADATFDAVLLDAPCTGLGTLRRRPEIAMRLKAKALEKLAARQRAMLAEAWRVAKPGGRIVYSVCTIFAAETVDVVAGYPAAPPQGIPGMEWGKGVLLAPHLTDTDGMFIAAVER
ncbi:MAG: transcription antitermination factor NusB [Acidimicrobiia bacterium]|nr:transcription antitermination factor NusB [Acidimicrobiia bacterium]